MNRPFEFTAPGRIVFGPGVRRQAGQLAWELGRRALVVTGRHPERSAFLLEELSSEGVEFSVFPVPGEPTLETARTGTARALETGADIVIGIGGGSAMDAAKAVAVLAANGGDPLDYLEVIGRGRPLEVSSLPVLAMPTTSGTGSEATRNAVLASPEHGVKASLRSVTMIPRVALVDPELAYGLPPDVTAATGLDALTQLIEPYLCRRTNPVVDSLCRDGMARAARSLARACANSRDEAARTDMALASLLGGLALANAGLGIVHGIAGPAGGRFPAPHGALCAALLPHALAVNRRALRERQPDSPVLSRMDEVARILTGREDAGAADGEAWLQDLSRKLRISSLASYGIRSSHVPELAAKALAASSTKANPVDLSKDEVEEMISNSL
ncbi:MAG TPA: iron-containing alcohol dehydrogenase [Kiritimatiellia bacterium]|nr:iron-containing alcohol dehydrogenase [Kiritimatiellia bacterium]HRX05662.1 iron-containing alcohol dehydrogenase [Kiritimatiellia bacterium]